LRNGEFIRAKEHLERVMALNSKGPYADDARKALAEMIAR
jgi:hypothetical protein